MIEFTKELKTGCFKIDEQHKELINRLNSVVSSGMASITKEETEKTLRFLNEYVVKHFSDEEMLQKQSGYPKYEWHKEQHKLYIKELQELYKEYVQNGASPKFTLKLNKSIIEWIVRHIKNVDLQFAKYYLAQ